MSVRNARKVVSQVRKLQEIAKGTSNPSAQVFSPVLTDIGQLVQEAAAFLKPLAPSIRITTRCAPDLPKTHADPDQIQQFIINLYDNSAEAIAETEGKKGSIDINVMWKPDESVIVVIYADDGPGIADQVAPRIFEAGFTTKENAEGVGLNECTIVAKNHGGDLLFKPGQKKGVLFSFRIPIVEEPTK